MKELYVTFYFVGGGSAKFRMPEHRDLMELREGIHNLTKVISWVVASDTVMINLDKVTHFEVSEMNVP